MRRRKNHKGVLTIEASISYSIFLMVIVTLLYLMRIVYAYGLIQHAVSQTAKEMSMYTYIYQVSGLNELNQQISEAASDRTEQFNADAEDVVQFYEKFSSGNLSASYNGTIDPKEILKNIAAALMKEGGEELNHQLFELVVRPLLAGYIGVDASEQAGASGTNAADAKLKALRIVDGMSGLNLNSSRFFEDGATVDLIVCYTIDPVMPIDILPELHLVNRAYIRGMNGETVFSESTGQENESQEEKTDSVWDKTAVERGKLIQEQEGLRNLPDNFPVYAAYDSVSGKATAVQSIDIRDVSYQEVSKLKSAIRKKCENMEAFSHKTYGGVTLDAADITSKELILYIPSSTEEREVDRSTFDQAVSELQKEYPEIHIVAREID